MAEQGNGEVLARDVVYWMYGRRKASGPREVNPFINDPGALVALVLLAISLAWMLIER